MRHGAKMELYVITRKEIRLGARRAKLAHRKKAAEKAGNYPINTR